MRDMTGEAWTWRANLGRGYTLTTAKNGAKIVLGACVTGDYHAEIVARNEHGILEKLTPDHPVARLIEAAPDMLKALKKIRRDDFPEREQPLWEEVQAAIAKATPETQ